MQRPYATITIETTSGRQVILPHACEPKDSPEAMTRIGNTLYDKIVRYFPPANVRSRPAALPKVTLSVSELDRMSECGITSRIARAASWLVVSAACLSPQRAIRSRLIYGVAGLFAWSHMLPYNRHVMTRPCRDPIRIDALHHVDFAITDDVRRVTKKYYDGSVEQLPVGPGNRYIVTGQRYY